MKKNQWVIKILPEPPYLNGNFFPLPEKRSIFLPNIKGFSGLKFFTMFRRFSTITYLIIIKKRLLKKKKKTDYGTDM